MNQMFTDVLSQLLMGVVTLILTTLSYHVTKFLNSKKMLNNDTIQGRLAGEVIRYVEQVGKEMTNSEKFELAKTELITTFNKKGFKFTNQDIDKLIESAVFDIRNGSTMALGESLEVSPIIKEVSEVNTFTDSKEGIIIDGELYVKSSSIPNQ